MAIGADTNWYVRVSGNELNGGGFDSTISGAGTNYADQDSSQLNITDGATSGAGSTTLTSAAAGFTSAMVGNCIRIASGTNFQTGYYFITVYTNSTTVTLDRTPTSGGAGSGGTGRIGGAHASLLNYANGGTGTQPAITTPLAAGHYINIRGGGTTTPSSSDYNFSGGYWTFPDGDYTTGQIHLTGYNGLPRMSYHGLLGFNTTGWRITNCMFYQSAGTFTTYGVFMNNANGLGENSYFNCVFDQAGQDSSMVGGVGGGAYNCYFMNSGSTSAGSNPVVDCGHVAVFVKGCCFNGVRGPAVRLHGACGVIADNLIVNGRSDGILQSSDGVSKYMDTIDGNTIDNNQGHGINVATTGMGLTAILNNIISNQTQSGKKGINCTDSLAVNVRIARHMIDYNNYYNNTANFGNWAQQTHDTLLNPGYVDSSTLDYRVGVNMKAIGFPSAFLRASANNISYIDSGGVQRIEGAGGLTAVGAAG